MVDVLLLGPVVVLRDGTALDLGPRKQRMLLAVLALAAPRVVTTDRLLEALWGDDAGGKENALWVYISRLRATLEPDREGGVAPVVLVTADHGYALAVEHDAIDVRRFERDAARGAALLREDPAEASRLLRAALAEWRGEVLQEFAYDDFARPEIVRLEELRLVALENRISADLQLGAAGELIGELEALHARHPLRERFVGQLMLALYRSGRQADSLRTFARFRRRLVDDLGLDPSPELRRLEEQVLLHDERVQAHRAAVEAQGPQGAVQNPFKGLRAFEEADAAVFFGRDRLVADVVRRIGDGTTFIALVGPSGSGKSSIVRAGIVPAMRKAGTDATARWIVASMVPGAHPFAELEAGLLRSSLDAPDSLGEQLSDPSTGLLRAALRVLPDDGTRLLLLIDQFEELFTLVEDHGVRTRFLDGLLPVLDDPHGRVVVVATLRSDFYELPLVHAGIGARLGDAVVNVVPLQPDELEIAATEPAARSGLALEPALLATLVGDVIGQPGALPLFQYALTELVERRSGATLTLDDYRAIGGVEGALGARAEDLYAGLDDEQRQAARQFFLRLVAGAGGEQWSRRRVAAAEILALDTDAVAVQEVVDRYARHRLLTLDRDRVSGAPTVEVAHEALLTEWDRLHDWIEEAREDLDRHAALRAAITEWEEAGRDPDYLLTGARLRAHTAWTAQATMRLTATEQSYLDHSLAASEDRASAERERAAEEDRLLRSARWRLRALVGLLVLVLGGGTALLATLLAPGPPRVALISVSTEGNPIAVQVQDGFEAAARQLDIRVDTPLVPITDVSREIDDLLATGPDLVILDTQLASQLGVDLWGVVDGHRDITFAILDTGGPVADDLPPNATIISFEPGDGAFLVGAAAAAQSETGTVGFVGALPYSIDDFRLGFEAGVQYENGDVTVLSTYLVPSGPLSVWDWPGRAQEAATGLYAAGADVVFHAANTSGSGIHRAARQQSAALGQHLWGIGVDNDEWLGLSAEPEVRDHVLTSLRKDHGLAVQLAIAAYLDGELDDLTLGVHNGGLSLSPSGGHLSPAATTAARDATDAIVRRQAQIPPFVTEPSTHGPTPDATWTVRHDGTSCSGDLPQSAEVDVGDTVTIELINDAVIPVRLNVWQLQLPSNATWPDVADASDLATVGSGPVPDTGVVAGPGGRHAASFEPAVPSVWGVTCHAVADGVAAPAIGLITAVAVEGPVTATATATFTGDACSWEGPSTLAVGDVVQVKVRNDSDVTMEFLAGTTVAGSRLEDLTRPLETMTRLRPVAEGVEAGTLSEGFLHIDASGRWGARCMTGVSARFSHYPAVLLSVEG